MCLIVRRLALDDLVVLVDGGHSEEDTSSRTNSSHQIGNNGQSTNAHSSERGGSGDVAVEFLYDLLVTMTREDNLGLEQLLGNIGSGGSRDVDPGLGKESAGSQSEGDVGENVDRIVSELREVGRGPDVVSHTADRAHLSRGGHLRGFPTSQKVDENVLGVVAEQNLRDEEQVGHQSSHQDDGNVRGVEELDGEGVGLSVVSSEGHIHTETLEENDQDENEDGGEQVGDVGEVLSVESLL